MEFLYDYGILAFAPIITIGLLFVLFITGVYKREIILTTNLAVMLLVYTLVNQGYLLEAIYSIVVVHIIISIYALLRKNRLKNCKNLIKKRFDLKRGEEEKE